MQIEDWEKELKKQILEESAISPPEEKKIQEPIDQTKNKPESNRSPVVQKKQDTSGTWMFVLMLIVLALSTLYVYDDKTGNKIKSAIMSAFHSKPESKTIIESSDAEVAKLKAELEKYKSENKSAIDAIQAKLNTNSSKIGLMGMLLNENFTMIMRGEDSSDFIFFNRDWTLDRMPKHIELTEDDREYLKKMVRPQ